MLEGREAALIALQEWIRGNPGELLSADAERDAEAVLAVCDPLRDVGAALHLGWFYWLRHFCLPQEEARDDIAAFFCFFIPVYMANSDDVPEPLRLSLRQVIPHAPGGSPDTASMNALAADLVWLHDRTGQRCFIEQAVALFRGCVALAPDGHAERAVYLNRLNLAILMLAEQTGEAAPLTEAFQAAREAVAATPEGRPERITYLSNLASAGLRLFSQAGNAVALAEAAQAAREAVAGIAADHPERADYLNTLGTALQRLYSSTGEVAALAEGVQAARDAVTAATVAGPDRILFLNNLGIGLHTLFRRTGDAGALDESLRAAREVVAATSSDHPDRAARLNRLAIALFSAFELTGRTGLLGEAVRAARDAVDAAPAADPERAEFLSTLGVAAQTRAEHTSDRAALDDAIQAARDSVRGETPDAVYLINLSRVLSSVFELTGDTGALAESVQSARDAVAALADGDPDRAGMLNSLAASLAALAEQTSAIEPLAEAVQTAREAVAATPPDHHDRATHLNNLSSAAGYLFDRTGETPALLEAVQAARDAVALTPDDRPRHAMFLSNLSATLHALWRRARDATVLDEAVQAARDAVAATPEGHAERFARLHNLGIVLQELSDLTDDASLLAEAAQAIRAAIAGTPEGHFHRASFLSDLSSVLWALADETGDSSVLAEAVQAAREAVAVTPHGHPGRAQHLSNLGDALIASAEKTGEKQLRAEAEACFVAAAEDPAAPPLTRINAYRRQMRYGDGGPDSTSARLRAAEAAVSLVELAAAGSLARFDRAYQLSRLSGLPGDVAAAAIAAGVPGRAVELLEQTRGILIADTLDTRGAEYARLRRSAPDLTDELDAVRARLDDSPAGHGTGVLARQFDGQHQDTTATARSRYATDRQSAYADWQRLVTRARTIPGFEDFLKAPRAAELTRAASDGPIVILTSDPARCDALILTGSPNRPVLTVTLPDITHNTAVDQLIRLHTAQFTVAHLAVSAAERAAAEQEILGVLAWLWDTVTEPVLAALGFSASPGANSDWPRVWWCPVHAMTKLPLHAAGHHADLTGTDPGRRSNPRTVLDRAVSSYTPTVRSLLDARARQIDSMHGNTLIVAASGPPGDAFLPGAHDEAAAIAELIPDALLLPDPSREAVLAALPDYPVAHFACHGLADWNDPARSHLALRTGPLTVADITALRLTGTLAYLSACDTSVTGSGLIDESIHLTGAFHLAGYRQVIGTLWPVRDHLAEKLAKDIYARLTDGGTKPPDARLCAEALHHATRTLRSRYPSAPTRWAGHTHTGI